jgi:hypothetical protein
VYQKFSVSFYEINRIDLMTYIKVTDGGGNGDEDYLTAIT